LVGFPLGCVLRKTTETKNTIDQISPAGEELADTSVRRFSWQGGDASLSFHATSVVGAIAPPNIDLDENYNFVVADFSFKII
jgi:hypothetical protein